MSRPALPPGGLLRLDAVWLDGDAFVRIRSAAALGPPLAPYTLLDWGWAEGYGDPNWYDVDQPVLAVESSEPLMGIDRTGFRSTCSSGPYVVAGAPLVAAGPGSLNAYVGQYVRPDESDVVASISAELFEVGPRWAASSQATQDLGGVADALMHFGHPLSSFDGSFADPLQHAWGELDPWVQPLRDIMANAGPWDIARERIGDNDSIQVDFGAWLAAVSADPAAAALLGSFGRIPLDVREGLRMMGVVGAFAIPEESDVPAHLLARDWWDETSSDQSRVGDLMAGQHDGLPDVVDGLSAHDVVYVWAPAIVVPLPDPPAVPGLTALPAESHVTPRTGSMWRSGLTVSGHQGGPVATDRSDGRQRHDEVHLLPPTGQLVDEGWVNAVTYQAWVQDPWGQWSDPAAEIQIDPPPPALPAPPTVSLEVEPAVPGTGAGPATPATVVITAFLQDNPIGGDWIVALSAELTGTAENPVDLEPHASGRWWSIRVPVRPTMPGEQVHVQATVTADTALGNDVPAEPRSVEVVDPRPVVVPATSASLLFAGPRRPDGTCEVDVLTPVPAGTPAGTTYRLYAADESSLAGHPAVSGPRHARVSTLRTLTDRTAYVSLGKSTVSPDPRGLRIRVVLPGRSTSLRVLQLVPVTSGGIETPAARCRSFVVAAPLDDTPATPSLDVQRRPVRRELDVTVSVTHPRGSGDPRSLRLRGLDHDAPLVGLVLWAPAVATIDAAVPAVTVTLAPDHPAESAQVWRWTGHAPVRLSSAVPAYAPLRFWARVAWPAEAAHAPGVAVEPPSVRPTWGPVEAQRSEWSPPSASAVVTAAEPRPAVRCSLEHQASSTSVQVRLPAADPASPGWTVVVSDARFGQLEARGPGPILAVVAPLPWTEPQRWRVSVTCPDGSSGGLFDVNGFPVSADVEPGDPPAGGQ